MRALTSSIVLFLVLVLTSAVFAQGADPWLNGFPYRKAITITGSTAGAQTNYQTLITVAFVTSKMKTDFSDIRFTASDGVTLIDHWRESYTASSTANFWVEVPSIPASPTTTTIFMYYGNSAATTLSSGPNTFLFFSDWGAGTIDGWTIRNGGGTGSGTVLTYDGSYKLRLTAPTQTNRVQANKAFAASNSGMMVEGRLNTGPVSSPWDGVNIGFSDGTIISNSLDEPNNGYMFSLARDNNIQDQLRESVAGVFNELNIVAATTAANTYYIIGFSWYGTSLRGWRNRSNVVSATDNTFTSRSYVFFGASIGNKYFDWVFVRKYVQPEPAKSIGTEDALVTQAGTGATSWSWKVPAVGEKVRNGSATNWSWVTFQNDGVGLTLPRGSTTNWQWGP